MKETFTIREGTVDLSSTKGSREPRKSSQFSFENNEFATKTNLNPQKDFLITSMTAEKTRINRIFQKITAYDDDIYAFEITGKIANSPDITWSIYKTYKELKDLFDQIKKEISKKNIDDEYIKKHCKMVKHYSEEEMDNNLTNICKYIVNFYNNETGRNLETLNEALRISASSFTNTSGHKPFEGYALKKAEPRHMRAILRYVIYPVEYLLFKGFNKRWLILKDDMISYLNSPTTVTGKNVYWFDEDIEVSNKDNKVLEIKNLSRILSLKFDTTFERDLWKYEIDKRVKYIKDRLANNKYHSFTSQKSNCSAKWFVDADSYFTYLLNQLKGAKETVYVTDWFMSPELALKRPINYDDFIGEDYKNNLNFNNVSRLMDIFYLLAKRGVKIYILLYCEVSLALAINSSYTKNVLKNLHPNILITRHPKNDTTLLWSHHEKLVIIDQKMAFVGGLDLCYGRYDTNDHPIVEEENENHTYYYPGCDYANERKVDFHELDKFYKEQLDRNSLPRMAWHDVHTMVEGPIVSDIVRHFVERWNDARFNTREKGLVNAGTSFCAHKSAEISKKDKKQKEKEKKQREKEKKQREKEKKQREKEKKKNEMELRKKNTIVENKNFPKQCKTLMPDKNKESSEKKDNNMEDIKEEENEDENYNENKININNNNNNENDVAKSDDEEEMNQDDRFFSICQEPEDKNKQQFYSRESDEIFNKKHELYKKQFTLFGNKNKGKGKNTDLKRQNTNKYKLMKIKQKINLGEDEEQKDQSVNMEFNIQALRSVSEWSIGKNTTECSILTGYYNLIDNAKHYIYIENQFFITKTFSEDERKESGLNLDKIVKNEIGYHLRCRIERAYQEKSNFRVFVCIPLLPGFSGTPGESSTMNGVLKHTFQSISHNKKMSLLEKLREKLGDDIDKYIYFFSLRNHGKIKDVPVTELIYIHSKLMIVDDEKVLMGSANINDRSMIGSRDSEFAVIVEQQAKVNSTMDKKEYLAADYAKSLRKHLMSEHMGFDINDPILDDPLNNELWNIMKSRARSNTNIYRELFDCYPDNNFKTFNDLKKRKLIKTEEEINELKEKYESKKNVIRGHIVKYPIHFLQDEQLDIDFFSKENLIPEKNFT